MRKTLYECSGPGSNQDETSDWVASLTGNLLGFVTKVKASTLLLTSPVVSNSIRHESLNDQTEFRMPATSIPFAGVFFESTMSKRSA